MAASSTVTENWRRPLFRRDTEVYTVADVVDAADWRGELEAPWRELRRRLACEERAAEEEREPDDDAIDAAAQAFRYDYDLITAEETERWLAERGLTLEDFSDYFARRSWSEVMEVPLPEASPAWGAAPELRDLLLVDLVLGGELERMAQRLSWRVAAGAEGELQGETAAPGEARQQFLRRLEPLTLENWKARTGRDEAWLDLMAVLEANFRNVCERMLTPQNRQRELGSVRLELTAFDLETIEFDSRDAACEALCCARDDGLSMEQVATEGRFPYRREQMLLEDIAPELQQQCLSLSPGEFLEPVQLGEEFQLWRVLGKAEPHPDDPAVRQRIDRRLLERHFSELVGRHLQAEFPLS